MNALTVKNQKTKYSLNEHLTLFVDNIPLDEYLQSFFPEEELIGLVPTLLDWVESADERKVIWDRILPSDGQTTKAPILMCPDDLNFGCTIIIAEVKRENELITWTRFGRDNTLNRLLFPDKLGNTVVWFEQIAPLTFSLTEYCHCIDTFDKSIKALE